MSEEMRSFGYLCPKCGKNLNDGECSCRPDADPRFAVLEQLLDK